jgi:hypothetical protein
VLVHVNVDGFIKPKKRRGEAHSRNCQTFAASPAEPVGAGLFVCKFLPDVKMSRGEKTGMVEGWTESYSEAIRTSD